MAERMAVAKSWVSKPISRWLISAISSRWTISMGSSMVTTWHSRVRLMWPIMAASVVVLPDPVGPVTRIKPRCSLASLVTTSGRPRSSAVGTWLRTRRNTMATEPRCRNTLVRKRPTPGME